MAKTKQQLVVRALRLLGVVGTGQEPAAENVQLVGDMVTPLFARLEALDITQAQPENEIDDAFFEPLAILLAQEATIDFGLPKDQAAAQGAIDDLHMLNREDAVSPYLKTDVALPRGWRRYGYYQW